MRSTNSLHPAGRPAEPVPLLFLRRIIVTLTSSWLADGICTPSSSIVFGTSRKAVLVSSSPCSRVEKCFLLNLRKICQHISYLTLCNNFLFNFLYLSLVALMPKRVFQFRRPWLSQNGCPNH